MQREGNMAFSLELDCSKTILKDIVTRIPDNFICPALNPDLENAFLATQIT